MSGITATAITVTESELAALHDTPAQMLDLIRQREDTFTLDKAWDGLRYLLSKGAPDADSPLHHAVLGYDDTRIWMEQKNRYVSKGSVHFFAARQVQTVAAALADTNFDDIAAHFDAEAMETEEVYPLSFWNENPENALDYLHGYFDALRDFLQAAARNNHTVAVYIG